MTIIKFKTKVIFEASLKFEATHKNKYFAFSVGINAILFI